MSDALRHSILGIDVDLMTVPLFFERITESIDTNGHCVIAHHNLHSIYLYHHDIDMRAFYHQGSYYFIDGMSIIFWMKLLGLPAKRIHRFTSIDWIDPLMKVASEFGWRVMYVGGQRQVAERGAEVLRERYPGLVITTQHGYFDAHAQATENRQVLEDINRTKPHLLLVGMGMPQQEHWILANLDALETNCIIPVGGCFDYVAGSKPIPPRWMSRLGFEWLGRLITEPSRLWRRYLFEPWFLTRFALKDLFRYRILRQNSKGISHTARIAEFEQTKRL